MPRHATMHSICSYVPLLCTAWHLLIPTDDTLLRTFPASTHYLGVRSHPGGSGPCSQGQSVATCSQLTGSRASSRRRYHTHAPYGITCVAMHFLEGFFHAHVSVDCAVPRIPPRGSTPRDSEGVLAPRCQVDKIKGNGLLDAPRHRRFPFPLAAQ